MRDYHGIIFAYSASPELRELVSMRTAASLPFCGRYRLIDFALSSMRNAGIVDVGVIMQKNYQSLLDHIGSGKAWDMSRKSGGLRMLPPFGLPEYHTGNYTGTMEALNAVSTYIRDIQQGNVVLLLGNVAANIDLTEAIRAHRRSGSPFTAICSDHTPSSSHHRYIVGGNGKVERIALYRQGDGEGYASLEGYIIRKDLLLKLMDYCKEMNYFEFHKHAVARYLESGGEMDVYVHPGYAEPIFNVDNYYKANMDMLEPANRHQLFPADRPVRTKRREGVSTYYREGSRANSCLIADNCIIEGELENCIVFSGARIGAGAKLKNCILMRECAVGEGAELENVIVDKHCSFSPGSRLAGSPKLPMVVPKYSQI